MPLNEHGHRTLPPKPAGTIADDPPDDAPEIAKPDPLLNHPAPIGRQAARLSQRRAIPVSRGQFNRWIVLAMAPASHLRAGLKSAETA